MTDHSLTFLLAHAGWLAGWSVVAFIAYAVDKRRAKAGHDARGFSLEPRIREGRLHALALIGGFAGAWLGRRRYRHKTRKRVFGLVIALAAVLHAAALVAWLIVLGRWYQP